MLTTAGIACCATAASPFSMTRASAGLSTIGRASRTARAAMNTRGMRSPVFFTYSMKYGGERSAVPVRRDKAWGFMPKPTVGFAEFLLQESPLTRKPAEDGDNGGRQG